jgi:hypothetical protein
MTIIKAKIKMKNKNIYFLVLLFSAFTIFFACKKDRVEQDDYESMESFYTENQEEEQELQVDSGSNGNCVVAKKGTIICMSRDELQDAGGVEVPSYPFQLKVIELYSIKDMILRRQPSTSGTSILETSAEIKVRPFKDGSEVYLKPGRKYAMATDTFPSTNSNMVSYYGTNTSVVGDWTSSVSSIIPGFVDTLSSVYISSGTYVLTPAITGYVSAARAISATNYTPITLTVNGIHTENIEVWISFNNFKSVMKVTNLVSAPVPIGEEVTLIAFGKRQNNEYVIHLQTFTVTSNFQIPLNMQVTDKSGILTALGTL